MRQPMFEKELLEICYLSSLTHIVSVIMEERLCDLCCSQSVEGALYCLALLQCSCCALQSFMDTQNKTVSVYANNLHFIIRILVDVKYESKYCTIKQKAQIQRCRLILCHLKWLWVESTQTVVMYSYWKKVKVDRFFWHYFSLFKMTFY